MIYDESWIGMRSWEELFFAAPLTYLLLVWIWRKRIKYDHPKYRFGLATLSLCSFFIIVHYYYYAPFFQPLASAGAFGVLFAYWLLLVYPTDLNRLDILKALCWIIPWQVCFVMLEDTARVLMHTLKIPEPFVVIFSIMMVSNLIFIESRHKMR
tara:strand:+ start:462 stop:923 length:462 start_codon:yes stop_codon:yes gene_type:complete